MSTAARKRLDAFVGEWTLTSKQFPGEGRATFEWLGDAPLLVQRTRIEVPGAPQSISVIGCDATGGGYYQLYTDDRDVQRVYEMSLAKGVWKLWRHGQPFSQRFTGRFSKDGKKITGRWEKSDDRKKWVIDFDLDFTKVVARRR